MHVASRPPLVLTRIHVGMSLAGFFDEPRWRSVHGSGRAALRRNGERVWRSEDVAARAPRRAATAADAVPGQADPAPAAHGVASGPLRAGTDVAGGAQAGECDGTAGDAGWRAAAKPVVANRDVGRLDHSGSAGGGGVD